MEAAGATVGKEKRGDLRAPQGSKGSDVRHPSGRSGARRAMRGLDARPGASPGLRGDRAQGSGTHSTGRTRQDVLSGRNAEAATWAPC